MIENQLYRVACELALRTAADHLAAYRRHLGPALEQLDALARLDGLPKHVAENIDSLRLDFQHEERRLQNMISY